MLAPREFSLQALALRQMAVVVLSAEIVVVIVVVFIGVVAGVTVVVVARVLRVIFAVVLALAVVAVRADAHAGHVHRDVSVLRDHLVVLQIFNFTLRFGVGVVLVIADLGSGDRVLAAFARRLATRRFVRRVLVTVACVDAVLVFAVRRIVIVPLRRLCMSRRR